MKVKLVAHTKAVGEFSNLEFKDIIAFCARVSNPSNQTNTETASKLVDYLIKNKHWSPFEMVSITMEIETTRDIARQILRHRSFSFQEFSQRYADPTKELEFVVREARLQDTKNRQNSIEINDSDLEMKKIADEWETKQKILIENAKEIYEWAISKGIAKEQARSVLPEGNTVSRMYISGTLRSFIHYIEVRRDIGTQKEHREIALEIAKNMREFFPYIKE